MAVNAAQFRTSFPEFSNTTTYPDAVVNLWLNFAYLLLSPARWRAALDMGAMLYTAHYVTLQGLAQAEGANGAPPGLVQGPISAKTVGELSLTYDTALTADPKDGPFAQTMYGSRFIFLARQFGSGPVQTPPGITPIGIGGGGVFFPQGQAWPGPWFENLSE